MSLYGAFDSTKHLSELATGLPASGQAPTMTAAERQAATLANLYGTGVVAMTEGSGIAGTGTVYAASVQKVGEIYHTKILIDLTGLNGGGTLLDIIGGNGLANCHIGQVTAATNGAVTAIQMTCLEAPAGSGTDIDLYSASVGTGVEDADVSALAGAASLIASGAAWTNGRVLGATAVPAAGHYLYLAEGGTPSAGTYTAGKFLLDIYGV